MVISTSMLRLRLATAVKLSVPRSEAAVLSKSRILLLKPLVLLSVLTGSPVLLVCVVCTGSATVQEPRSQLVDALRFFAHRRHSIVFQW